MQDFLRGRASEIVTFIAIFLALQWPINSIVNDSTGAFNLPMYGLLFLMIVCLLEFKRAFRLGSAIPLWIFELLAARMIIGYTFPVLVYTLPKYATVSPYVLLPCLLGFFWGSMLIVQSWKGFHVFWQSFLAPPSAVT